MTVAIPMRHGTILTKGWRIHLTALTAAAAALLLLFRRDATDIVRIWFESSTYNHCMLILPIIGWLVWQRLPQLRQLQPRAWLPGLVPIGAGGLLWLLGDAAGVALARHIGLIVMLQGLVIACLGKAVARGLTFPIVYAWFLIPAGDELIPPMQTITADMSMALLGLVGIPAHIDGVFITTPSGYFEVAEACSGVKFLVAMLAYGALVANLCFRSWPRRLAFMAAAIVIPILANGVRAWGTIYVASLTSADFAEGFDHVLYGWIFFGIVIALLMAAGWRFFDRDVNDPWFDPRALQQSGAPAGASVAIGAIAAAGVALAALPLVWSTAIGVTGVISPPMIVPMPAPVGWQRIALPGPRPWAPHFKGADRLAVAHYRDGAGRTVDLAIAVFARQGEGRELVGFGQGAVEPGGRWAWAGDGPPPSGGRLDRIASFGAIREVASFYRIGASLTGSPLEVKLETMRIRLLGGPQRAVAVLVSSPAPAEGMSPRPAIDSFLAAIGPIDRVADRAAGLS